MFTPPPESPTPVDVREVAVQRWKTAKERVSNRCSRSGLARVDYRTRAGNRNRLEHCALRLELEVFARGLAEAYDAVVARDRLEADAADRDRVPGIGLDTLHTELPVRARDSASAGARSGISHLNLGAFNGRSGRIGNRAANRSGRYTLRQQTSRSSSHQCHGHSDSQ
jgi:hypothetical protein